MTNVDEVSSAASVFGILVDAVSWVAISTVGLFDNPDPYQMWPNYYVAILPDQQSGDGIVPGVSTYDFDTNTFHNPPPPPLYTQQQALDAIFRLEAEQMIRRGSREIEMSVIEERAQKQADAESANDPETAHTKEQILDANIWYQKLVTLESKCAVIRPYLENPTDDY